MNEEQNQVVKLVKNGRAYLKVSVLGEPVQIVKFPSESEAAIGESIVRDRLDKPCPDPDTTIKDFYPVWMEHHVIAVLSGLAERNYKNVMTHHVLPRIGDRKLAQLDQQALKEFAADLRGAISEPMLMKTMAVLSSMLTCAVRWRYLSSNPAYRVLC